MNAQQNQPLIELTLSHSTVALAMQAMAKMPYELVAMPLEEIQQAVKQQMMKGAAAQAGQTTAQTNADAPPNAA